MYTTTTYYQSFLISLVGKSARLYSLHCKSYITTTQYQNFLLLDKSLLDYTVYITIIYNSSWILLNSKVFSFLLLRKSARLYSLRRLIMYITIIYITSIYYQIFLLLGKTLLDHTVYLLDFTYINLTYYQSFLLSPVGEVFVSRTRVTTANLFRVDVHGHENRRSLFLLAAARGARVLQHYDVTEVQVAVARDTQLHL